MARDLCDCGRTVEGRRRQAERDGALQEREIRDDAGRRLNTGFTLLRNDENMLYRFGAQVEAPPDESPRSRRK